MSKEKNLKAAKGQKAKKPSPERDFSYTQNRELSWLRFDDRVLDEAYDEKVPLFERLKFCEIFDSNLNEWFMIRVGGLSDLASLKNQPKDNKSNETPAEQLDSIFAALPPLVERHEEAIHLVEGELAGKGLARVEPADYTEDDLAAVKKLFDEKISPIASPLVVDPRHPFPNLRSGRLYVACSLTGPAESGLLGIIEVPTAEQRAVPLPSSAKCYRYTLVEDVIRTCLGSCFGDFHPQDAAVLRVTRNADIDPDDEGVEEEEDYRQHMKKVLKMRQRLQPVRLEVQGDLDKKLEELVASELGLEPRRVFHVGRPLDLGYVYGLEGKIPDLYHSEVVFRPFEPQPSDMVVAGKPMREQVEDHDVLLTYPYESMTPLLSLLREASADDACIQIKITLYRVAKSSHLCESLIAAAENGKDVTVLMELRARFDEANNIAWAERLEDAGCTVIYGSEGFKCHSKICQVTYHDQSGISRITCLGTGNFNEKTARLYSDFMLLTANPGIAEDGNVFFRNLSLGNLRGQYKYLGVAPISLKPLVMRGIDREIGRARRGEPARIFLKMNSLTDRDVIDKISEACEAGVEVQMTIRGIACIKAGVPGKTDGLEVRQIVGRFLEHARIYAFGDDADIIYLSSADMMTRNTERRVEIAYPVFDPTCREIVKHFIALQHADNVKARRLDRNGEWRRVPVSEGEMPVNSQETLLAEAYERARLAAAGEPSPRGRKPEATAEATPAASSAEKTGDALAAAKAKVESKVEHAAESEAPRKAAKKPARPAEPASTGAQGSAKASQLAAAGSAKAPEGRFARAFALIGEGFRTLFSGK